MRWISALVLVAIGIIVAISPVASPVRGEARNIPIYSVERAEQMVALTFNGAWGPDYAEDILDILDESGVQASFFVLNVWLEQNPESARRVAADHEIAMHSATHADPTRLSVAQVQAEVRANCHEIVRVTGVVPLLYRAPAGAWDERTVPALSDMGFAVVQWSVDSIDWTRPDASAIVDRVCSRLKPGDIVLFHTNVAETVTALPEIIKWVKKQGWEIVTVSQLLLEPPFYVDHAGRQRREIVAE